MCRPSNIDGLILKLGFFREHGLEYGYFLLLKTYIASFFEFFLYIIIFTINIKYLKSANNT